MYSMVLMAALTTGVDMPDRGGRRGGGCCGCQGGMGMGYGGGYGGCMGMGYGGGYGGMGWGGCYGGMGMGWGGGYGGMHTVGNYGMGGGWGGWGNSGYVLNNFSSGYGNYAFSPQTSTWGGTPFVSAGGTMLNPGGSSQSFYFNPMGANEATIIVHLPTNASLSIDGQQTQQRSNTRVFTSPSLQPGKTYTYTLRAEMNRDGRNVHEEQNVDVRAGQSSEVRFNLEGSNRGNNNEPAAENQTPARRTLPTPPPDR